MPLGNTHKDLKIWGSIVEKTEKRLARWKAQYISFGGRHILINFVLDSIPTYVMSLFTDKLRRDFLWHGCIENKGYNLVKWATVLHRKDKGGLGIIDLRKHNNSLLMKWLWRYTEERQALWKDLIKCKYGEDGFWCSNISTDAYGAGVWRAIRNLWPKLEANLHIKVGDGKRTRFWWDVWIKQTPLKDMFRHLFILCTNSEAMISDCWTVQGWNLYFRRLLNDWEIERVAKLLEEMGDFAGTNTANDVVRWSHSKDGIFTVGRAYKKECTSQSSRYRSSSKNI
ncbi:hypothetical protein MTR67_008758 [Solanum verrucosum]|uniref:Uncharacterized protein n=1 Tax=Solanum verrucosum TaxID=315347 RepID=A0AAF0Q2N9_SOLVR|nr:hypothetical protein MTR67_008758 [Solanum verrucosum]